MDVLQSRKFAGRIVDRLNLIEDPPSILMRQAGEGERRRQRSPNISGYSRHSPLTDRRQSHTRCESPAGSRDLRAAVPVRGKPDRREPCRALVVVNQDPRLASRSPTRLPPSTSKLRSSSNRMSASRQGTRTNTGGAVAFLRQSMDAAAFDHAAERRSPIAAEQSRACAKYGQKITLR